MSFLVNKNKYTLLLRPSDNSSIFLFKFSMLYFTLSVEISIFLTSLSCFSCLIVFLVCKSVKFLFKLSSWLFFSFKTFACVAILFFSSRILSFKICSSVSGSLKLCNKGYILIKNWNYYRIFRFAILLQIAHVKVLYLTFESKWQKPPISLRRQQIQGKKNSKATFYFSSIHFLLFATFFGSHNLEQYQDHESFYFYCVHCFGCNLSLFSKGRFQVYSIPFLSNSLCDFFSPQNNLSNSGNGSYFDEHLKTAVIRLTINKYSNDNEADFDESFLYRSIYFLWFIFNSYFYQQINLY